MGIGSRVNQLHIDPDLVSCFLHATLKNIRYAKLLCDLREIAGFALILLRGSARNYFQVSDASKARQDLLMHAIGKIGLIRVSAEILKRQNSDSIFHRMTDEFALPNDPACRCSESE